LHCPPLLAAAPRPSFQLQTVEGNPAKDITTEEFNDILAELKQVLLSKRREARLKRGEKFIICVDEASVHKDAEQILAPEMEKLPHAPHSPECNKPVEHCHGQVDAKMKAWLVEWRRQHPTGNPTPDQCKAAVADAFRSIPTASIAADVATMPDTWQAIVDAGGGFIKAEYS
jgi:hypothetical protein